MTQRQSDGRRRTAGIFDLRWIIALLMGIFGLVVTVMGLFGGSGGVSASGHQLGANVNLWSGIPMLVLAALFAVWALAKPTVLEESSDTAPETKGE